MPLREVFCRLIIHPITNECELQIRMNSQVYSSIQSFAISLANCPDVKFESLHPILSRCKNFLEENRADNCINVDTQSISTLSLGICTFLRYSEWKFSDQLVNLYICPFLLNELKIVPIHKIEPKFCKWKIIANAIDWAWITDICFTFHQWCIYKMATCQNPDEILKLINIRKSVISHWLKKCQEFSEFITNYTPPRVNSEKSNLFDLKHDCASQPDVCQSVGTVYWHGCLLSAFTRGILEDFAVPSDSAISLTQFLSSNLENKFCLETHVITELCNIFSQFITKDNLDKLYAFRFSSEVMDPNKSQPQIPLATHLLQSIISMILRIFSNSKSYSNIKDAEKEKIVNLADLFFSWCCDRLLLLPPHCTPESGIQANLSPVENALEYLIPYVADIHRLLKQSIEIFAAFSSRGDKCIDEKIMNIMSFLCSDEPLAEVSEGYSSVIQSCIQLLSRTMRVDHNDFNFYLEQVINFIKKPSPVLSFYCTKSTVFTSSPEANTIYAFTGKFPMENNFDFFKQQAPRDPFYFNCRQNIINEINQCLCRLLKMVDSVRPNVVSYYLTNFTHMLKKCVSAYQDSQGQFIAITCIQSAATIACTFYNEVGIVDSVIACFLDLFATPPTVLDSTILCHMVYVMLSVQKFNTYFVVVNVIEKVFDECVNQIWSGEKKSLVYGSCHDLVIYNLLFVVAKSLKDLECQVNYACWLMNMFCHISRKSRAKIATGQTINSKYFDLASKLVFCLSDVLSPIKYEWEQERVRVFRKFWIFAQVMGFSNDRYRNTTLNEKFQQIGFYSPSIAPIGDMNVELVHNSNIGESFADTDELLSMRQEILKKFSPVKEHVNNLKSNYVVYLLAISRSQECAMHHYGYSLASLFSFLESLVLYVPKLITPYGFQFCIITVCKTLFQFLLNRLGSRPFSYELEVTLVRHALLLITKICHPESCIRDVALSFLGSIIIKFPHIQFNFSFLYTVIFFVQNMKVTNLSLCSDVRCTNILVSDDLIYTTANTADVRKEILDLLVSVTSRIFRNCVNQSPLSASSVIQEFLQNGSKFASKHCLNSDGVSADSLSELTVERVELLIFSILSEFPQRDSQFNVTSIIPLFSSTSMTARICSNEKKSFNASSSTTNASEYHANFLARLICVSSKRNNILGRLKGIAFATSSTFANSSQKFNDSLFNDQILKNLKATVESADLETFESCMLKACARIISIKNENGNTRFQQLLHSVCITPVRIFTKRTLNVAIESWDWILSSRPDLEYQLTCKICMAWEYTIHHRLGIFRPFPENNDPFQISEEITKSLSSSDKDRATGSKKQGEILAHDIWISYLDSRYEAVKYFSPSVTKLYVHLVLCSLTELYRMEMMDVEECILPFLRLIILALRIIRGSFISNMVIRNLLREKIYRVTLKLFGMNYKWSHPDYIHSQLAMLTDMISLMFEDRNSPDLREENSEKSLLELDSRVETIMAADIDIILPADDRVNNIAAMLLHEGGPQATIVRSSIFNSNIMASTASNIGQMFPIMMRYDQGYLTQKNKRLSELEMYRLCNLCLHFLKKELDRLSCWHFYPIEQSELYTEATSFLYKTLKTPENDHNWPIYVNLAHRLCPAAVVGILRRFGDISIVRQEVTKSVIQHAPSYIRYGPMLELITNQECFITNQSFILKVMQFWENISFPLAFKIMCKDFGTFIEAHQCAVSTFEKSNQDTLLFYNLQLIQALRSDAFNLLEEFMIRVSKRAQLFAHRLIWSIKTNIYLGEDAKIKDPLISPVLERLYDAITTKTLDVASKAFLDREFEFFDNLANISETLIKYEKPKRLEACKVELQKVKLTNGVYLPTNPDCVLITIDYDSGRPMQSAAKAPFLAKFQIVNCGTQAVEHFNLSNGLKPLDNSRVRKFLSQHPPPEWKAAIFKCGDDVRQDMLALQIISLFQSIFQHVGLDVYLCPYKVVATGPGRGVIECIPNATSRHQLGEQTMSDLTDYFLTTYKNKQSKISFEQARENFIKSMAAYSVVSYMLRIKDRHNGNIMIHDDGYLIHIDFGFIFEIGPGKNIAKEAYMKLTKEMVDIMGGINDPYFKSYIHQSVQAFLAVRHYTEEFIHIVNIMLPSNLPCFASNTIQLFRSRFMPNLSEREAAKKFERIIEESRDNILTYMYDKYQYTKNDVQCAPSNSIF